MKAVEFESRITPAGEIAIPRDIAEQIPAGEQVRVLVMWQGSAADSAWRSAGRERFEATYSPEDSIYDQLINDTEAR